MRETKWTPGPWIEDEFFPLIYDSAKGAQQVLVATVAINTRRDEGRYNARLIAAAPDLYEALEGLDAAYCRSGDALTKAERHEDCMRIIAARAALARARGEA